MKLPLKNYPLLVRFVVLGIGAFFFGRGVGVVSAETLHRIKFTNPAKIIVWEGPGAPVSGDTVGLSGAGSAAPARIPAGLLEPVTGSDTPQTFRVASNTPFAIRARIEGPVANPNAVVSVTVTDIGPNAQLVPVPLSAVTASTLSSPQTLFQSAARTAATRGSPRSQSIAFQVIAPEIDPAQLQLSIISVTPAR